MRNKHRAARAAGRSAGAVRLLRRRHDDVDSGAAREATLAKEKN